MLDQTKPWPEPKLDFLKKIDDVKWDDYISG